MKIILVEDDPLMMEQLSNDIREIFGEDVKAIYEATNTEEAMEIFSAHEPQIALLDIHLGTGKEEAGILLAEQIKGQIPFVFVSGLPDHIGFEKARHALPVAFLRKPYTQRALEDAIRLAEAHTQLNKEDFPLTIGEKENLLWVTSGRGEYSQVNLGELTFLQVEDHYIKAFSKYEERPVMFKYNLKDFHQLYLQRLPEFFYLDRSRVINLRFVKKIEGNHVYIGDNRFSIPRSNKQFLFARLGI